MTIRKIGFIYKAYHKDFPEEFYIGSTGDVERRRANHKHLFKKYRDKKHNYVSIYSIFEKYENLDDIVFETIDSIEYEVVEEHDTTLLRLLEDDYIRFIFPNCVNKHGAYHDKAEYLKEYHELNKDKIVRYNKKYRELNKDKIAKYAKERYQKSKEKRSGKSPCPVCKKEMRRDNITRHIKNVHKITS